MLTDLAYHRNLVTSLSTKTVTSGYDVFSLPHYIIHNCLLEDLWFWPCSYTRPSNDRLCFNTILSCAWDNAHLAEVRCRGRHLEYRMYFCRDAGREASFPRKRSYVIVSSEISHVLMESSIYPISRCQSVLNHHGIVRHSAGRCHRNNL